jgi:hypothetical protein
MREIYELAISMPDINIPVATFKNGVFRLARALNRLQPPYSLFKKANCHITSIIY